MLSADRAAVVHIPPPSTLRPEDRAYWNLLELAHPVFRVADGSLFGAAAATLPLNSISWIGLHPLAALLSRGIEPAPPRVSDQEREQFAAQSTEWSGVRSEFYTNRIARFDAMRRFLREWRIMDGPSPSVSEEPSVAGDEKVLGLHRFRSRTDVVEYVHRWQENPELRNEVLKQHQCILSRAIDLICSELVANGFDHGRLGSADSVRIMAKLSPPWACQIDLDADQKWHHLSESECELNDLCVKKTVPQLQLVIFDSGRGFQGNQELKELFRTENDRYPSSTDELVKFALRGDVTTKPPSWIYAAWLRSTRDRRQYRPRVHGLSEVFQTAKRIGALWRIHTGDNCTEFRFFAKRDMKINDGRPERAIDVGGCIHYFAIPLLEPDEERRSRPHTVTQRVQLVATEEIATELAVVDMAEFLTRKALRGAALRAMSEKDIRINFEAFWAKLRDVSLKNRDRQVIFYVRCFSLLRDQVRAIACAAILDAIARLGEQFIPILTGLDLQTLSAFRRFTAPGSFVAHAKVIPAFLWTSNRAADALELILGPDAEPASTIIHKVLTKMDGEAVRTEILDSSDGLGEKRWQALANAVDANPRLLKWGEAGSEPAARSQLTLPLDLAKNPALQNLADARVSFQVLKVELEQSESVLRQVEIGRSLLRLGAETSYYVHLGRLLADESIQAAITRCFRMHLQAQGVVAGMLNDASRVEFVATLHPAIEAAHHLAAIPPFMGTNVVAVRRRSDIRFDHDDMMALAGKDVVIVADMIFAGELVSGLLDTLALLNVRILAILAIVDVHAGSVGGRPVLSFCRCTRTEIEALARPPARLSS